MPQLNPDPWFFTMLSTWMPMFILMTKITISNPTKPPTIQTLKATKTTLAWLWH